MPSFYYIENKGGRKMTIVIGSARSDEKGHITGGAPGDAKQTSTPDYKGEVSFQNFYVHSKGWYILRAKDDKIATAIAKAMETACNNPNIGYSQSDRYGIVKHGTATKVKVNADCSSTVRTCVKEASGIDPGDFNTSSEVSVLQKTGLFKPTITYKANIKLYVGDILVTQTKGHTAIITQANARLSKEENKTESKKETKEVKKIANPYKEPTKDIKNGSKGEGVKWVQWELNSAGAHLTVDGIFGAKTEQAVKDYQKKNKLKIDGIVGTETRKKMKKD